MTSELQSLMPTHDNVPRRDMGSRPDIDQEANEPDDDLPKPQYAHEHRNWWWWWWWWWCWWEIAASALSVLCCILVVAFMATIDNKPRSTWHFQIEPNTVISIITSIAKAAMMVPVAACLSQLKWQHFTRDNPLSHLQWIDDASRGPWGALTILLRLPRRALAIGVLSLITVFALGFEPSAQQLLSMQSRVTELTNSTAEIGIATSHTSKGLTPPGTGVSRPPSKHLFELYASLTNGLIKPPMVEFDCPGDTCSWPDFTTLAVCASFENVTDAVQRTCRSEAVGNVVILSSDPDNISGMTCNYTYSNVVSSDMDRHITMGSTLKFVNGTTFGQNPSTLLNSEAMWPTGPRTIVLVSRATFSEDMLNDGIFDLSPVVTTHMIHFYLCSQRFQGLAAVRGKLYAEFITSEEIMSTTAVEFTGSTGSTYSALNSNESFYLYGNLQTQLFASLLPDLLNGSSTTSQYPMPFTSLSSTLGALLYSANLEETYSNLAQTMTSLIRNRDEGDNYNVTMLPGTAFITEAYFVVQWPWIMVIFFETLVTAALLALSIVITRNHPLLKSSVVALLLCELRGHKIAEELHFQSEENLEQFSKGIRVRLLRDKKGGFEFEKTS